MVVVRLGRDLAEAELGDLRGMLSVRGVLPAPEYDDEPQGGPRGLQGGGGRKRKMGMRAPPAKRQRQRQRACSTTDDEHEESAADAFPEGPAAEKVETGVAQSLGAAMAGSANTGWFCQLLNRRLGTALPPPAWYMDPASGATRAGVQARATCGLHAVNHAIREVITWSDFDARARPDERKPSGDWEFSALQRNVEAVGGSMTPITTEDHQQLSHWVPGANAPHLSLWRPGVLGCVMHVPGHWVALTPPQGPSSEECAALLCDSLRPCPYALSSNEVGELFALVAVRQQVVSEADAAEWSLRLVEK
jgi:hypothetical protein